MSSRYISSLVISARIVRVPTTGRVARVAFDNWDRSHARLAAGTRSATGVRPPGKNDVERLERPDTARWRIGKRGQTHRTRTNESERIKRQKKREKKTINEWRRARIAKGKKKSRKAGGQGHNTTERARKDISGRSVEGSSRAPGLKTKDIHRARARKASGRAQTTIRRLRGGSLNIRCAGDASAAESILVEVAWAQSSNRTDA